MPQAPRDLPVLLALAGLPATGKSTLARGLARRCGARVLSKDLIRARLFPAGGPRGDPAAAGEAAMAVLYREARRAMRREPRRLLVIDGRTFTRPGDLEPVAALAAAAGRPLRVVELRCEDAIARARLAAPEAAAHPATDRDFGRFEELKARRGTLPADRLVLDSGRLDARTCLERCLRWLAG